MPERRVSPESESEPEGPSLDELFRKTAAKPVIYWNPRSLEEAAEVGKGRRGQYPAIVVPMGDLPDDLRVLAREEGRGAERQRDWRDRRF